ncbi:MULTISPECIES: hypothetical protein [Limimaricola]|uniref:Uncharacterized protein n=1 Tax=Limimaricola litoreus TaxID=2955316 RepID=A0A9X2JMQ9_9RHOB|nr:MULTISPECIES: hypothetical protein [Limimaricola]MCP1167143.1 hypothetical protein [Limimaricola litoreus]
MSNTSFNPAEVDIRTTETWSAQHPESGACIELAFGPGAPRNSQLQIRLLETLGAGWREHRSWHRPATPLPFGAPSVRDVPGILAALERRLEAAGVDGANDITCLPTGWVWIGEVLTHHLCRLAGAIDEVIYIDDIKEKFGSLRVYVCCDGAARAELQPLAEWAESASEGRCMVTGRPGRIRSAGWAFCLSDRLAALHGRDPQLVMELMYPKAIDPT